MPGVAGSAGLRPAGDPQRDAVEPGAEAIAVPHRAGFLHEHQKRCLEGVVGVGGVGERAAADAPDERAVPTQQRLERSLVGVPGERFQQRGVGPRVGRPGHEQRAEPGGVGDAGGCQAGGLRAADTDYSGQSAGASHFFVANPRWPRES